MKNNQFKLTKEWLIKAQNDLRAAEILYKEKGPSDTLCFHCHQAVEKYLKAYLVFKNIYFEKIHRLWELAKLCSKENKEFLNFEEELKTLDAYYIESRYPPEIKAYSRQECKKVLDIAEKLAQFILNKINKKL
ncbi:MAG: HEPN domain-containing protein [Patescibacteria group bacterium]|nr:HEPN domain-containing protein [Patescibacteria group bacterium]